MHSSLEILKEIAERDPLYRPAFSNAMQLFHAFGMKDEAEQLIKRIEAFNPDNPDLNLARATSYLYAGEMGKGLQQIEEAAKKAPLSGVGQLFLSIGLMSTGQFERALNEGFIYWRPDALYFSGRKDEAIALAREHADGGSPDALFYMLVLENREKELVDYLEERWPSLAAFAVENPGGDNGYDLMMNIAMAYRRTGNVARADEALELFEKRITQLETEGVNNYRLDTSKASYLAMQGDIDGALVLLKSAVDEGLSASVDPLRIYPEFEILEGDPRFDEIKAGMLDNLNYNRRILELPPFTENYQVAR